MNYVILRKIRAISLSREELLVAARKIFKRTKIPNLAEVVSYYSPTDPQEFYSLYFFWVLPEAKTFEPSFKETYPDWEERRQILQQEVFELVWEQRLLTTFPVASHFRLITLPASLPLERASEIITERRAVRRNRANPQSPTGLTGTWVGRKINEDASTAITTLTNEPHGNKIKFLARSDWASLEAQQNYFSSTFLKQFEEIVRKEQLVCELASIDLRGITNPSEEVEPTTTTTTSKAPG